MSLILSTSSTTITYADKIQSYTQVADKYHLLGTPGPANYAIQKIEASSVDGAGIKRHGFRSRPIPVRVCYVGATALSVKNSMLTDEGNLLNKVVSVTLPNLSTNFQYCECLSFTNITGEPLSTGVTFYCDVDIYLEQVRLND